MSTDDAAGSSTTADTPDRHPVYVATGVRVLLDDATGAGTGNTDGGPYIRLRRVVRDQQGPAA